MEEPEPVAAPGGGTMPLVELPDRVARERDERRVLGKGLRGRVGKVRQEREPQLGIGVGQVMHFQSLDDLFDLRFVGQEHRNRDERPQLGRDAAGELELREPPGAQKPRDEAVDELDREVGRRPEAEEREKDDP